MASSQRARPAPYTPTSNYDHLRELEWLVGNWMVKIDGKVLEMSCEWTGKRNTLIRKYTIKEADGATEVGYPGRPVGTPWTGSIRGWGFRFGTAV